MRSVKLSAAGRAGLAITGAAAMLVLRPIPVAADHQGNGTSLANRDNNSQDVEKVALTNAGNLACDHGKSQLERSEVTTAWGTTDIHCHDANYGATTWAGQTGCTSMNWSLNRCDHYELKFNYYYNGGSNPDTTTEEGLWKSTGCHEFGHTSSVGHRTAASDSDNNSCMQATANAGRGAFDAHDLNAIDSDA